MKETVMQFVGNIPYYYHKGSSRRNTHTHKNAASLKGNNRITHTLSQFITWQFFSSKIPSRLQLQSNVLLICLPQIFK